MRVMTYNLWNYTSPWQTRRAAIAHLIVRHMPDVVGVQEARHDFRFAHGRGQGEQLADLTAYAIHGRVAQVYVPFPRVDEGLALLTRSPTLQTFHLELTRIPSERADENHRLVVGARVSADGAECDVYNTHFSLSSLARRRNAEEVASFVTATSGQRPSVLLGDLNAEPDDPAIGILKEAGFVDCWEVAGGPHPGYTYPAQNGVRRIDYILVRNVPRVRSVTLIGIDRVEDVYPSDHAGLLADLVLSAERCGSRILGQHAQTGEPL